MDSSQNEPNNSTHKSTRKVASGTSDSKPKFHVDYLLSQDTSSDYNQFSFGSSYRYNYDSVKVTDNDTAVDVVDYQKPTKRLKSEPRSSPPSAIDHNYDDAKCNVLQVLQPTSTSSVKTYPPTNERKSPMTLPQQHAHSNKPDSGAISHTDDNNNTPTNLTQNSETQKQEHMHLLTAQTSNSANIAAFAMPSLTALATYPMFNWCAKCNSSFRMTSDLVHHMRTQHKGR